MTRLPLQNGKHIDDGVDEGGTVLLRFWEIGKVKTSWLIYPIFW